MPAKSRRCGASLVSMPAFDKALVRAVDVVGPEPEVTEVDLRVVGTTQLELEAGRGVGDEREAVDAHVDDHPERGGQALHLLVEVGHGQGDVVDARGDHRVVLGSS